MSTFKRPPADGEFLDRRQVMEHFGWSSTYLWRCMRERGLPYRKNGRRLTFVKAEVVAWIHALPGQRPAGSR